jgi:hypothetical protein
LKLSTAMVEKLIITDVPDLDPIAVYLEDQGPGAGKITITCFNDCWSNFWSHMGETYTIRTFFQKCDVHYLADKLRNGSPTREPDPEKLEEKAKRHIIERRKLAYITKDEAREQYEDSERLCDFWHEMNGYGEAFKDAMFEIFGDDWHDSVPMKPHHQYEYLCRIVKTVQEAIQQAS